MLSGILRTARLNHVKDNVVVKHAIVGAAIHVYGRSASTPITSPPDIPQCDVLQLDCEGAELIILKDMRIRPRTILVETHGLYGSPTRSVGTLLKELGYNVQNLGVAEPTKQAFCANNDIYVLMGTS